MSRIQTLSGSRDEGVLSARAGSPALREQLERSMPGGRSVCSTPAALPTPALLRTDSSLGSPRITAGRRDPALQARRAGVDTVASPGRSWLLAEGPQGQASLDPQKGNGPDRTPVPEGLLRALRRRTASGELGSGRDSGRSWEWRERDGLSFNMCCANYISRV